LSADFLKRYYRKIVDIDLEMNGHQGHLDAFYLTGILPALRNVTECLTVSA